eukprot:5469758-Prymnesium_polylepis.1
MDLAVLVASTNASNMRRIENEDDVARQLRAYFERTHPRLRFVHVDLQSLSFMEEVQIFRRARVLIALF